MCRCRPHRAAGVTLIFIASAAESEDSPAAALSDAGIPYLVNFSFFGAASCLQVSIVLQHTRAKRPAAGRETRGVAELHHAEMMMFIGV